MQNVTDLARKKCHVEGIPARLFVVPIENYQETAKYKCFLSSIPESKLFHFSKIDSF